MKIRKLMLCAAAAMTASCVGVYLLVPVGDAAGEAKDDVAAPAGEPEVEEPAPAPPEPETSLAVEARIGHVELASNGDRRTYVMVEVRGKPGQAADALATSTALVIDTSGSMAGARMQQAVEAARRWVDRAPDGDLLTVIGFADRATDLVPRLSLDAANRSFVGAKLATMQTAGDTCLSCGVDRALTTVGDPARVQRVVVLSDGRANLGIRDVDGIRTLAGVCRDRGISVSTIGLGIGYDEKVLSALAFDANGLHHFVADASDLPQVFAREEETLRATVASGVSIDVELGPGVELFEVFGRQFRQTGQRVSVDVGPIASGATRTVLFEVRVPAALGATPVATARVAFRDVVARRDQSISRALATEVGATASALDGLVAMRLEKLRTAVALEQATALFAAGNKGAALDLLDRRVTALRPRAAEIEVRARQRGDGRAKDIGDDLNRQVDTAERARERFQQAKPKMPSGDRAVKHAAPDVFDAYL